MDIGLIIPNHGMPNGLVRIAAYQITPSCLGFIMIVDIWRF
jgi:hypothetical protein